MKIDDKEWTIGADPEFFLEKNSVPESAHGLIPGDKEFPHIVENGAVQVDGMAAEFNINPATTSEEFIENLTSVENQLLDMVPDHSMCLKSSVIFPRLYMQQQPYESLELGCSADFNAYSQQPNSSPSMESQMRTAGGHVHIGGGFETGNIWEKEHFNKCCNLTKFMDEQLGVYSVLWDNDDSRRKMYGKASSFRPKFYGVEYRTLSNAWIFDSQLMKVVFDYTKDAIEQLFIDRPPVEDVVAKIINTSDRDHEFFKNNPKADRIKEIMLT